MPDSVFDLGGELVLDTNQLKTLSEQVETELAKVGGQQTTAKINVDDGQAKGSVREVKTAVEDLGKTIEKKHTLSIDTSKAQAQARSFGESLADDFFGPARKSLDEFETKLATVKEGGGGSFLSGRGGLMVGGTMMAAGLGIAASVGGMAIKSAYATDLMDKSTEQVFGAAADRYKAEAEKMAGATGFMTTQILAAQITMNKAALLTGLKDGQVQPMVARAADLADSSGLPQYANNIEAVTSAIAAGLRGTTGALLDFGIRLDDLYVLSLPVNREFKKLGDALTPAQMAQARYNAIMQQSAEAAGAAADNQDDMTASMREFSQKMEGAKEAVGEALIPVANTIADFIASIPKPLLEAGVWAGIGVGIATALGGAVIGINALIVALKSLMKQSLLTAATTAASGGGGKGGLLQSLKDLLKLGGKAAPAAIPGAASAAGQAATAAGGSATAGTAGSLFSAAAGGGSGMTAGATAATTAAGGGAAAAAAIAAPIAAAAALGALPAYGSMLRRNAEQEYRRAAHTSDLAAQTSAKATGMGDADNYMQADYVATQWGRDYRTGELIAFNQYTQRLGQSAQEAQRQRYTNDAGFRSQVNIQIDNRADAAVRTSTLDSGSYEQTAR